MDEKTNLLIVIVTFILILDTVISFTAIYFAFTNKGRILKNKLKIALNKKYLMKMEEKNKANSDCVKIMQGTIKKVEYKNMAFGIVDNALNNLGYTQNTIDTNGWEVDYWSTYNKSGFPIIEVKGSMYYGDCIVQVKGYNEDGN